MQLKMVQKAAGGVCVHTRVRGPRARTVCTSALASSLHFCEKRLQLAQKMLNRTQLCGNYRLSQVRTWEIKSRIWLNIHSCEAKPSSHVLTQN